MTIMLLHLWSCLRSIVSYVLLSMILCPVEKQAFTSRVPWWCSYLVKNSYWVPEQNWSIVHYDPWQIFKSANDADTKKSKITCDARRDSENQLPTQQGNVWRRQRARVSGRDPFHKLIQTSRFGARVAARVSIKVVMSFMPHVQHRLGELLTGENH